MAGYFAIEDYAIRQYIIILFLAQNRINIKQRNGNTECHAIFISCEKSQNIEGRSNAWFLHAVKKIKIKLLTKSFLRAYFSKFI